MKASVVFGLVIALGISLPVHSPAAENIIPGATTVLDMQTYLGQVKQANSSIRASLSANAALELSVREAETVFSPYLTGEASRYDSLAPNAQPMLMGNRTLDINWNLGLSKRWSTGTLTSLNYQSDWSKIEFPSEGGFTLPPEFSAIFPSSDPYYTAGIGLSISQPLWKDFMAKGSLAAIAKARMSAASLQTLNKFKIQQILFSAQQAYIQLSLARTLVALQEESLERNRRILEWSRKREATNLGDRVDTLQSQAAVKQVEVGLTQSREDLRNAITSFNAMRAQDPVFEVENLAELSLPANAIVAKQAERADIQAAEFDLRSLQASVNEIAERYLPDLSVFASASLNGRDKSYSDAVSESFGNRFPVTVVGLRFSANLDWPLIHAAVEGAQQASGSGEQALQQNRRDLETDWANLQLRWKSVNDRLQAASELESLQKEKADREKVRFRNGRTTNYQVLRFEEDYAQAQLFRQRLLAEAAMVLAQAQLYNGELY